MVPELVPAANVGPMDMVSEGVWVHHLEIGPHGCRIFVGPVALVGESSGAGTVTIGSGAKFELDHACIQFPRWGDLVEISPAALPSFIVRGSGPPLACAPRTPTTWRCAGCPRR